MQKRMNSLLNDNQQLNQAIIDKDRLYGTLQLKMKEKDAWL